MNVIDGMQIEEVLCVYMQPGEDFHECIEKVAEQKGIQAGAILSGIGTFDKARIHHIVDTEFPATDKFVQIEGPVELCSVDGIIADYKPHMHCSMALRGGELFSGHLEPGCRVLYLAEVVIARLSGAELERDEHPEFGTPRLKVKGSTPALPADEPDEAAIPDEGEPEAEQEDTEDAGAEDESADGEDGGEGPADDGDASEDSSDTTMIV
jgi:predicted DNA-binding protein with PD1-like motif